MFGTSLISAGLQNRILFSPLIFSSSLSRTKIFQISRQCNEKKVDYFSTREKYCDVTFGSKQSVDNRSKILLQANQQHATYTVVSYNSAYNTTSSESKIGHRKLLYLFLYSKKKICSRKDKLWLLIARNIYP